MRLHKIDTSFGGIVQLVEHRTHIPYVIGSSPIAPNCFLPTIFNVVGIFFVRNISWGLEPTVLLDEIVDFVETRSKPASQVLPPHAGSLPTYCPYLFLTHDIIFRGYFFCCTKPSLFFTTQMDFIKDKAS